MVEVVPDSVSDKDSGNGGYSSISLLFWCICDANKGSWNCHRIYTRL